MSRPLRIEFPGAVYHVTSRGDRREAIYGDDADRRAHLVVIGGAMDRFDAQVLAYCLMGNHYHLVLHTRQANLSRLMRQINGVYTQDYNRRHGLVGHLFQGRFKAILVDRDAYLLALCRYVDRNPVAAKLVSTPGDWAWSSYRAHVGRVPAPDWLDTNGLHGYLLGRSVKGPADRIRAGRQYAELAASSKNADATFWRDALRGQVFLGDDAFVRRMLTLASTSGIAAQQIPKAQRLQAGSWAEYLAHSDGQRSYALYAAYRDGGMTMTALAREARLSVAHVGRLIRAVEEERKLVGDDK